MVIFPGVALSAVAVTAVAAPGLVYCDTEADGPLKPVAVSPTIPEVEGVPFECPLLSLPRPQESRGGDDDRDRVAVPRLERDGRGSGRQDVDRPRIRALDAQTGERRARVPRASAAQRVACGPGDDDEGERDRAGEVVRVAELVLSRDGDAEGVVVERHVGRRLHGVEDVVRRTRLEGDGRARSRHGTGSGPDPPGLA